MRRLLPLLCGATFAGLTPALASVGDCTQLTGLQVAAGYVTWLNVMRVAAIIGLVACGAVLLKASFGWLVRAFAVIPVEVYEVLGYGASLALLAWGWTVPPVDAMWPALGGALLFGAMLAITTAVHRMEGAPWRFFAILFIAWTAVAFTFANPVVGFFAVGAFMGMLGFSAAVIPMGYAVGFTDKDSVPRATSAALLTSIAGAAWYLAKPAYPNPLLEGALWFGPFVFFLGLLITASRWYRSDVPYAVRQLAPIVFGFAGLAAGTILGIPHLAGIAGTFCVLYLIEKAADIPAETMTGHAAVGFVTCAMLGAAVYWAQHHVDMLAPYMLF